MFVNQMWDYCDNVPPLRKTLNNQFSSEVWFHLLSSQAFNRQAIDVQSGLGKRETLAKS
jgi:hypothetical protein